MPHCIIGSFDCIRSNAISPKALRLSSAADGAPFLLLAVGAGSNMDDCDDERKAKTRMGRVRSITRPIRRKSGIAGRLSRRSNGESNPRADDGRSSESILAQKSLIGAESKFYREAPLIHSEPL